MTKELEDWRASKRTSIDYAYDPTIARLLEAAEDGELIEIIYFGGSSPGSSRWISPRKLFKVAGYGVYVEAYCENRKEVRTFLTEKISFAHKHDPQRSLASAGMPTDSSSSSQFQSSSKTTGGALIYWVIGIGLLLLAIYW